MKFFLPTFIVLPILEIIVLIEIGSLIGSLFTISLILFTALLGIFLLRKQGLKTLKKAKIKMQESEIPTEEIFTGLFLAIGGILLLIPGFITDVLGLVCLVPKTRKYILNFFNLSLFQNQELNPYPSESSKEWIEGEYKKEK